MKKLLVALVLTLSMTVSAMALTTADFSDFPAQDSWQYDGLSAAVKNGLLNGENGKILPDNSMTRAQMATILVRAFQGQKGADLRGFVDVDANAWYYDYLSKAVQMKIFNGDGNQMRPNDSITRQEAFLVLSRAFALNGKDTTVLNPFTDAASIAPWAKEGMAAMVASGYVKGDGKTLNPLGSITRAEFAVTMDRMVKTYLTKSETVSSVPDGSVMINVPDVTLKNAIVKGNLIIGDGVGEGDVILDNVKVEGNTIVRGGGTNSVIVKGDSSLGYVSVCKVVGDVRLSVEGNAKVGTVNVTDGKDAFVLQGTVSTLNVSNDGQVHLNNATVEKVTLSVPNANIQVGAATKVVTLAVSAPATTVVVSDGAKVTTVAAVAEATGVNISAEKGSQVTAVISAAPETVIQNDGKVGSVQMSKEATDSTYAIGKNADTNTKVTSENKDNLTVTTKDAYAAEQAAKAAQEAAAKAEADRLAAEKLAADAAKAAAEADAANKAEAEAAAKAAKEAADKAAADAAQAATDAAKAESSAKQEQEAAKDTVSKVEESIKEDVVDKPVIKDDEVVVPPTPTPEPPTPGGGGGGGGGGGDSKPALPAISGLTFTIKDSSGGNVTVNNSIANQATLDLTGVDDDVRIATGQITTTTPNVSDLMYSYAGYSVAVGPECTFSALLGIINNDLKKESVSVGALNRLLNEWWKQSQNQTANPIIPMPSGLTVTQSGGVTKATVNGKLSSSSYTGSQDYTLILKCDVPAIP